MIKGIVRGDIDGFFGLFIDNLLQLLLIQTLCMIAGIPADFVLTRILPAAAISILFGNLFYAWQARQLMKKTGRTDVTALPYGINTVSLIAFTLFIMAPVFATTQQAQLAAGAEEATALEMAWTTAWQVGVFACFVSGLMELVGAFCATALRRHTPRAALLAPLAGIALTFIAVGFVFQIFNHPGLALAPTLLLLAVYAGNVRLPWGIPGGLAAVLIGAGLAWILYGLNATDWTPANNAWELGLHLPVLDITPLTNFLQTGHGLAFMSVIFPMGLFNIIGSLQNLESAAAAGDDFPTRPSLAANGIGTLLAALLGSPFPTTIYIGHPAWKAMGARAAYSTLNGIVITVLCLIGAMPIIQNLIPLEVMMGILLWIGVIITAQAFTAVPVKHAIAVAVGLIPSLAAWALFLIEQTVAVAGGMQIPLADVVDGLVQRNIHLHGIIALERGFILSSIVLAAFMVHVVEKEFQKAAAWLAGGGLCAFFGITHAFKLDAFGVHYHLGINPAPVFAWAYLAGALVMLGLGLLATRAASAQANGSDDPPASP